MSTLTRSRWRLGVALCHVRINTGRMNTHTDDHADDLEPGLSIALRDLLQDQSRGDDPIADLCLAARISMQRRVSNSNDGGLVIAALRRRHGLSWRAIERCTGIPTRTARRWATPPPAVSIDAKI